MEAAMEAAMDAAIDAAMEAAYNKTALFLKKSTALIISIFEIFYIIEL